MKTDREHLDAETVAAWIDGGLDAASLAAAEAHASNCDRCQALLATVAQTLPKEDDRAARAAVADRARSIWRWWVAPIAAATAAVTIWMVVPQAPMQPTGSNAPQSDVAAASAPPAAERVAPSSAPAEPPARSEARADARPAAPKREGAAAKEQFADAVASKPEGAGARDREAKQEVAALQETITVAPAAPAPPAAATAPAARNAAEAGAAVGAVAESRLQRQSGPLEIISPDSRYRWRVLADTIEHSQDGGRSWIPVRLLAGDVVAAGTSPAAGVCWLVGARGLVLLATDGTNFTRLPFPERADLVSITAADARQATVSSADGRTFATTDSGRNWRNP